MENKNRGLLFAVPGFLSYRNSSRMNTVAQQATETVNRLAPFQANAMPAASAASPAYGLRVVSMMAGKVITASVTYGT